MPAPPGLRSSSTSFSAPVATRRKKHKEASQPWAPLDFMAYPASFSQKSMALFKRRPDRRTTKSSALPRLVFLDLDNTLIPTAWMMEQWRMCRGHPSQTTASINARLEQAGLFTALDNFFLTLVSEAQGPQKIVIVTNAAIRTVQSFYLTYCIPQLGALLEKYQVTIKSTEKWLEKCGPVPSQLQETQFREYYTHVKQLDHQNHSSLYLFGSCPPCGNGTRIDLVSVGDQLCEITAAIRLGVVNTSIIRHTKLLMILDFVGDRFVTMTPEGFVMRLQETLEALMDISRSRVSTVVPRQANLHSSVLENTKRQESNVQSIASKWKGQTSKRRGQKADNTAQKNSNRTAIWVTRTSNLAYCIGRPRHFNSKECCPFMGLSSGQTSLSDAVGTTVVDENAGILSILHTKDSALPIVRIGIDGRYSTTSACTAHDSIALHQSSSAQSSGDLDLNSAESMSSGDSTTRSVLDSSASDSASQQELQLLTSTDQLNTTSVQDESVQQMSIARLDDVKNGQSAFCCVQEKLMCSSSIVVLTG